MQGIQTRKESANAWSNSCTYMKLLNIKAKIDRKLL